MTRPIPDAAVDFVARHEGCELTAYRDAVGVWTIGYGSTAGVVAGLKISQDQARVRLQLDLEHAAERIAARIGAVADELTVNQYAALLSFVFNVGAGEGWTIWKRLRSRAFDQIPGELIKFVNAGGKKLQGLVNRRADEIKLWSTDEPGSTALSPPSSETRAAVTPPTPSDPTPASRSAQLITLGTGAVATVGAAAGQVSQAITPYAEASELVKRALSVLAIVAAVAVTVGLALAWLKKREARS